LHALNSATEATSGTNAMAAATLRRVAGLTMGRAYPGDDAGRNGPRRSGIISSSPATMRAGTARGGGTSRLRGRAGYRFSDRCGPRWISCRRAVAYSYICSNKCRALGRRRK
jgi:hypothetical protein